MHAGNNKTRDTGASALIAFMAATAQAQAEAIKEADGGYKGRKPSYSREQYQAVRERLSQVRASASSPKKPD